MGASYSNLTLHGPDRARIIQALEQRGRRAYVGPASDGFVVVFDEQSDDNPDLGAELARELTAELRGLALATTVHDDDIFAYWLVRDGELVDQYLSRPGYFDGTDAPPEGGDAALLTAAFGAGNADAVERVLRAPAKEGDYLFETGRHSDLAELLGLPGHSVGFGFNSVYQGDAEELEGELANVGFTGHDEESDHAALRARFAQLQGGEDALAQIDALGAAARNPAHGYFRALLAGDAAGVRALFAGDALLDDPVSGRVDAAGLDAHVAAAKALFGGSPAQYTPVGLVETAERVVAHGQMVGNVGAEPFVLPCACVWERGDGGFRELRAYWSPAGLKGQRGERAPIVQPNAQAVLPEPVSRHLAALAADDVAAAVATYDPTCLAPMPWLDPEDTVRRHYGAQVGEQGAVVLTPCIVTAADTACAVEFVTTRWDGADVPAQAGVAVYELKDARICQVHVFGDLAPSPSSGLGGLMGGFGGMDLGALGGMGGMAGMGDLGGMAGLGDLGGMAGMPGIDKLGDIPPEVMQQAMDEVMRMMSSPDGMAGMMKNLQQMMGGMGGMPGMGGPGGMDLGALGGFPGMGAMPAGWDDDAGDHADATASPDDTSADTPSADTPSADTASAGDASAAKDVPQGGDGGTSAAKPS